MFDYRVMVTFADIGFPARRTWRQYVDVIARFGRDGDVEPVRVLWKDGRTFVIERVIEHSPFGTVNNGVSQACYTVLIRGEEKKIYLERREPVPAIGKGETLRWWVWALADPVGARDQS